MKFLSQEEIAALQVAEAQSNKKPKKTTEQIQAIYSSGQNILVSASAGSGKTFVMAERILDKLARGVEIRQLFISTFTVKAATELKERLEKKISQQIQETQDLELKKHLGRQLADLPNAAIGTMDSFTQKFLTKHGYLLDLAPNFRILQNESEQLLLKNEVFRQIFEHHYQGKDKDNFSRLVKNFAGRSKDARGLRKQVYMIYDFLQSTSNPQTWLQDSFLKGFEKVDFTIAKEKLVDDIKEKLWDLESFFRYHLENDAKEFGKAAYLKSVQQVLDEIGSLSHESTFDKYQEVLERVVSKGGRSLTNASRKAELQDLKETYNQERKAKFEKLIALNDQITLLKFQEDYHQESWDSAKTFQVFMRDFVDAYRQRKREENTFEFADISHYTIEILENFPQVRQEYQERFHEVMVDEYQDTNHIQERMLELLSNSHNRFMVGDIKQSIYRFRQADPQIFNEKFHSFAQDNKEGQLILLKENFRSSSEVLDATNDVFKHLMDEEVGEVSYDGMHQLVFGNTDIQVNPENKAEVLLYDKDDNDSDDEEELATNKLTGEMRMVLKEIIHLHNDKGVPFKDMALLTASRSRNDQVLLALSEYGIPVKTDGTQANYLQSLEVQVMLDTLRVIHNPLQDFALVALMKSPMFSFDEDELARLALQKSEDKVQENFYEKLVNAQAKTSLHKDLIKSELHKKLEFFMETVQAWRLYSKTHSLYDLIWKIYSDRFYYDYVGALPNGQARQANLYALALRADQFEKSNYKGLSRFIRMIDQVLEAQHDLANVAVAPPKDAVELMSIHKSKGLEFPYVFILNIDQQFNKQDSMSQVILSRKNGLGLKYVARVATDATDSKEEYVPSTIKLSIPSLTYTQNEEELQLASYSELMRLLYVAMTRAEKKLYLVGKGSREKLEAKEYPTNGKGLLTRETRLDASNFQDWIWAIYQAFSKEDLHFTVRFEGEEDLTKEAIGELENKSQLQDQSQADNRQSETIKDALEMLKEVEVYNDIHRAAINLPSVQTPSQIKKFYEPVMDMEGVVVAGQSQLKESTVQFKLPDFSKTKKVTGAEIGSATHELMQRINLAKKPTLETLTEALEQVQVSSAVKSKINLDKILSFFDTALGQEILANKDKLYREQPFSMLKRDKKSQESFVVRGILDGYLLYDDKIALFDYKTDRYEHVSQLVERYRGQLDLYAEALSRSYQIETVEKYLILLGKDMVEVVKL